MRCFVSNLYESLKVFYSVYLAVKITHILIYKVYDIIRIIRKLK